VTVTMVWLRTGGVPVKYLAGRLGQGHIRANAISAGPIKSCFRHRRRFATS
jgi:hypothetical protein